MTCMCEWSLYCFVLPLSSFEPCPWCRHQRSGTVGHPVPRLEKHCWRRTIRRRQIHGTTSAHLTASHRSQHCQTGMTWHDMAWHGMTWHDMAWHGMTARSEDAMLSSCHPPTARWRGSCSPLRYSPSPRFQCWETVESLGQTASLKLQEPSLEPLEPSLEPSKILQGFTGIHKNLQCQTSAAWSLGVQVTCSWSGLC